VSDSLAKLAIVLDANVAGFESDMGRAARTHDKAMKKMADDAARFGKAAAVAMGAAAVAVGALVGKAIRDADQLNVLAQRTGVSVKALSALGYAAKQSDIELGGLQNGLVKLIKLQTDAASGGEQQAAMFKALGVSATDATGKIRDTEEVFGDFADIFAQLKGTPEATALAVKVFGKSGADLLPMLTEGSEAIKGYGEQLRKLGALVDGDTAEAADKFGDQLTVLQKAGEGFGLQIAKQLLPSLTAFNDSLIENAEQSGAAERAAEGFADVLRGGAKALTYISAGAEAAGAGIGFLGDVIDQVKENIGGLADAAQESFKGALAASLGQTALASEYFAAAKKHGDAYGKGLKEGLEPAKTALKDTLAEIDARYAAKIAALNTVAAAPVAGGKGANNEEARKRALAAIKALREQEAAAKADAKALDALAKISSVTAEFQRRLSKDVEASTGALLDQREAHKEWEQGIKEMLGDYDDELRLMKLTGAARRRAEIELKAERIARDLVKQGTFGSIEAMQAEYEMLKQIIAARETEIAQFEHQAVLRETITGSLAESLDGIAGALGQGSEGWREFARTGSGALGQLGGAMAQFVSEGNKLGDLFKEGGAFIGTDGKPTQAFAALGNLFTTGAEMSGGGWGGAAMGAAGGAMSGYQAMGGPLNPYAWVGAVIGAIVGAYGGYGDDKKPVLGVSSGSTAVRTEASLQTPLGRVNVGTNDMSNPTSRQVAEAVQDFDRTIVDMLTGAQEQLARSALATYNFRGDGGAASIGEALEVRLETIAAGVFGGEVAGFLMGFSNDFQTQLQAFGDVVNLDKLIDDGRGVSGTLEETLGLITLFGRAGESAGQTYDRIAASTMLYAEALGLADVAITQGEAGFASLATTISDAVGGIDRAKQLFGAAFDLLYSGEERAQFNVTRTRGDATEQLADIGIDFSTFNLDDLTGFKQKFEEIMGSGNEELIKEWLEAAEALGLVIDAEGNLTDLRRREVEFMEGIRASIDGFGQSDFDKQIARIRRETADWLEEAEKMKLSEAELQEIRAAGAERERQAYAERAENLRDFMGDLAFDDSLLGMSDFDREVARINKWVEEMIAAAILMGAEEEDLARIRGYGANQIAALTNETERLAEAVRVSAGEIVNAQKAMLEETRRNVQDATKGIRQWLDAQFFSQNSSLNPFARLQEALGQFDGRLVGAKAGDLDSLKGITSTADQLLAEARAFYGSGDEFTKIEQRIRSELEGLTTQSFEDKVVTLLTGIRDGVYEWVQPTTTQNAWTTHVDSKIPDELYSGRYRRTGNDDEPYLGKGKVEDRTTHELIVRLINEVRDGAEKQSRSFEMAANRGPR
jgi:hypothetical protein